MTTSNVGSLPRLVRLTGSASAHGPEFEWKMAGLLAVRAHCRGIPFQIFSNVSEARPCDDLVVRLLHPPLIFYIQLKHSKKGVKEKVISDQALTSKSHDFSLSKYFEFYEKLRRMHSSPGNDDEKLLTETPLGGTHFILFTTREVERKTSVDEKFPFEDLFSTGNRGLADVFAFNFIYAKPWKLFENDPQKEQIYQEEFIAKLRVYCRQAYSDDLDQMIEEEMKTLYGAETKMCFDAFMSFLRNWAEDETQSFCLTNETLFQLLEDQLRQKTLQTFCTGLSFQAQYLCDLNAACAALRRASSPQRLRVGVRGLTAPGRRAAKLLQVLQGGEMRDRWMYVDGATLKRIPPETLRGAASLTSLLVTDVSEGSRDEKLVHRFMQTMGICVHEIALQELTNSSCDFLDNWYLSQLIEEEQNQILERPVVFQGRRMPLKELQKIWLNLGEEFDAAMLLASETEAIQIGKPLSATIPGFLPRRLVHPGLVRAPALTEPTLGGGRLALSGFPGALLTDVFALATLSNLWQSADLNDLLNMQWTILNCEGEPFPKIDDTYLRTLAEKRGLSELHHVEYVAGESLENLIMVWRGSFGNLERIRPFVLEAAEACEKACLCEHDSAVSLQALPTALLTGEAGVGKTTVMERIAIEFKEENPVHWVILVKILDHRDLLRKWQEKKSLVLRAEHARELLLAAAGAGEGAARLCLESALRVDGAVSVLVDGLDEVLPAFKAQATRLLELLRSDASLRCVWAASRTEVEAPLRRALRSPPVSLVPLTSAEQRQFLCERWASVGSLDRDQDRERFADEVVQWLAKEAGGVLATPLHLHMAAEAFVEDEAGDEQGVILQTNVSLLKLYDTFVERKRRLFQERHLNNVPMENLPFTDEFQDRHEQCAVLFLFADSSFSEELPLSVFRDYVIKNQELLKVKERFGIVWMDESGNLSFIHQTFAEYFAATWLWKTCCETLTSDSSETSCSNTQAFAETLNTSEGARCFLRAISKEGGRGTVLLFLQEMLAEEWPMHASAWRQDFRNMERLLATDWGPNRWGELDPLLQWTVAQFMESVSEHKGSALHSAAAAGSLATLEVLLLCRDVNARDDESCTPLHRALLGKNFQHHHKVARRLLQEENVEVNVTASDGGTPLSRAAAYDCVECLKAILRKGGDANGGVRPPMFTAALNNSVCVLRYLLENGFDSEIKDDKGFSSIHVAIQKGNSEALKILLENGASINSSCREGWSPVHSAAVNGYADALQLLLAHGASANDVSKDGLSPAHSAAENGHTEVLKWLLLNGASASSVSEEGWTPVHSAAMNGHAESIELLLSNGARADTACLNRFTPLHFAAFNGHTEAASVLLVHGASAMSADVQGETPVHAAATNGQVAILKLLLEHGGSAAVANTKGRTPLHSAAENGHSETVVLLLQNGCPVDVKCDEGLTPLHVAARDRHPDVVQLLLTNAAVLDCVSNQGWTPLHLAVKNGHTDVVRLLLESGATVNLTTEEGFSPLHLSAFYGHLEVLKLLLLFGALVRARTVEGFTPLHAAVHNTQTEAVQLLLKHDSPVNEQCQQGWTGVHLAVDKDDVISLQLLVAHGALVNVADVDGDTPLHNAAFWDRPDILKTLLHAGADVDAKNSQGKSPLDLARGLCTEILKARLGCSPEEEEANSGVMVWSNGTVVGSSDIAGGNGRNSEPQRLTHKHSTEDRPVVQSHRERDHQARGYGDGIPWETPVRAMGAMGRDLTRMGHHIARRVRTKWAWSFLLYNDAASEDID